MAIYENPILTGSTFVSGTLGITGFSDVSESLASISASAANSVSDFTELTNVPSGLISGSSQVDFNSIQNTNNIISSSAQISYSSITNVPSGIISGSSQIADSLPSDTISSSAQIATDISGAFDAASASLASDIAGITTFTTAGTDIVSSSAQIASDISGAFASSQGISGSFNTIPIFNTSSDGVGDSNIRTTPIADFSFTSGPRDLEFRGSGTNNVGFGNRDDVEMRDYVGGTITFPTLTGGDATRRALLSGQTFTIRLGDGEFMDFGPVTHTQGEVTVEYDFNELPTISANPKIELNGTTNITGSLDVLGDLKIGSNIESLTGREFEIVSDNNIRLRVTDADSTARFEATNGAVRIDANAADGGSINDVSITSHGTNGHVSLTANGTGGEVRLDTPAVTNGTDASPNILAVGASGRLQTTNITIPASSLPDGTLSSSAQIATDISGAFDAASASLASDIAGITTFSTAGTDIVSGSAQIATDISGAFDAASASLASDIAGISEYSVTNEANNRIITSTGTGAGNAEANLTFTPVTSTHHRLQQSSQGHQEFRMAAGTFGSASLYIEGNSTGGRNILGTQNAGDLRIVHNGDERLRITSTQIQNQGGSQFSGSFIGDGSGLTGLEAAAGTLSSSAQIATDISGSITEFSSSVSTFTQYFTTTSSFIAQHNFGTKNVVCALYDDDDYLFFPTQLRTTDSSSVEVTMNENRSGRLVVTR